MNMKDNRLLFLIKDLIAVDSNWRQIKPMTFVISVLLSWYQMLQLVEDVPYMFWTLLKIYFLSFDFKFPFQNLFICCFPAHVLSLLEETFPTVYRLVCCFLFGFLHFISLEKNKKITKNQDCAKFVFNKVFLVICSLCYLRWRTCTDWMTERPSFRFGFGIGRDRTAENRHFIVWSKLLLGTI